MPSQRSRRARDRRARRTLLEARYWRPVRCEVRWSDDLCAGEAVDAHELKPRARGGSASSPGNVVAACRPCHDAAHANPAEAERRGILVPSWAPEPGGPDRV